MIATTRAAANTSRLEEIGADAAIVDGGEVANLVRDVAREGVDAALEVVGAATVPRTAGNRPS